MLVTLVFSNLWVANPGAPRRGGSCGFPALPGVQWGARESCGQERGSRHPELIQSLC